MMRYGLVLSVLGAIVAGARADDFAAKVDLRPLELMTVQDQKTIKTFDSFARQALFAITGRSTLDGRSPTFVVLDMSAYPDRYVDRNLIKIRNVPLRQDVAAMESLSESERQRIMKEGTVSLRMFTSEPMTKLLRRVEATEAFKASAIQQLRSAGFTLAAILRSQRGPFQFAFPPAAIIPPMGQDTAWRALDEMLPTLMSRVPGVDAHLRQQALAGYDVDQLLNVSESAEKLMLAWRAGDAATVNQQARLLAERLEKVNPAAYPSMLKRKVEVVYNRLYKLTLPGAALYFIAFACFLVSARAGVQRVWIWGLRLFVLALVVHTAGIGIRWWLVGSVFPPIKNQFESVMFSAWFGAVVGLMLELRRPRGVFGAAASFVGWLSLVALFATPYVFKRDIGGEIGQVAGILMTYWLYIHVTLVTASYALIGMGFLLSVWWLWRYYREGSSLEQVSPRQLSSDAADDEVETGGGAAALSVTQALARVLFIPRRRETVQATAASGRNFLATLDLCNLVVLQLAFWVLGAGVITGAIWADQSWGRPWGWDPKETFALVTWIVYLVVVHVRIATVHKAWWTAVLSVIGFFIMLFNWIGVNFFLVGLHSYA